MGRDSNWQANVEAKRQAKPKRQKISASLRWSVFSRDGFTCRYCGAQAGQEGVELVCDHVVSVAEGGDNAFNNLVTACNKCNGGKGARSLTDAPTSHQVIQRIDARRRNLQEQAEAIQAAIQTERDCEQSAVNLKCEAYGVKSTRMENGEVKHILSLCQGYGADRVLEWYRNAARNGVPEYRAIKYVYGIIRNLKDQDAL